MSVLKKKLNSKNNFNHGVVKKTSTIKINKPQPIKSIVKTKKFTNFYLRIRSRHPSANALRACIAIGGVRAIYRHGSTTEGDNVKYELNSVNSVNNAASKFHMKNRFLANNVKTAEFYFRSSSKDNFLKQATSVATNGELVFTEISNKNLTYPIIAKLNYGSRGRGMFKLDDQKALQKFLKEDYRAGYYFEKYYSYTREYRLHVSTSGCFYSCRKMLKHDAPDKVRWYRNDSNCIWVTQFEANKTPSGDFISFTTNPHKEFDQPVNWKAIEDECVKALKAVGLDVGACDLRVQSAKSKDKKTPDFIVVEINSAPSLAEITTVMYKKQLPIILKEKYKFNV